MTPNSYFTFASDSRFKTCNQERLHVVREQEWQWKQWRALLYLDVGGVDLSQEDLLRLQAAQLTQLFLQACVLFIHVQPQAVAHRRGPIQFNDYKQNRT